MNCTLPASSCPWGFSRQEYESGLLPIQESNLHCRQILYQLSYQVIPDSHIGGRLIYHLRHQGRLRILEWVAYPFSSRSSWPRNRTGVSCIAGGFFTSWAIREAKIDTNLFQLFAQCLNILDSPNTLLTILIVIKHISIAEQNIYCKLSNILGNPQRFLRGKIIHMLQVEC